MILSRLLEKPRIRVIPAQAGIHLDFCTNNLDPGLRRDDEQEAEYCCCRPPRNDDQKD